MVAEKIVEESGIDGCTSACESGIELATCATAEVVLDETREKHADSAAKATESEGSREQTQNETKPLNDSQKGYSAETALIRRFPAPNTPSQNQLTHPSYFLGVLTCFTRTFASAL